MVSKMTRDERIACLLSQLLIELEAKVGESENNHLHHSRGMDWLKRFKQLHFDVQFTVNEGR